MHFVSAVLDRWRGATSNRDVPNDPGINDRPAARVMTPVEAPMLQLLDGARPRLVLAAEAVALTAARFADGLRGPVSTSPQKLYGPGNAALRLQPEPFMSKPAPKRFQPPAIDRLPEDIRTRIRGAGKSASSRTSS
jgi:hypothetical protein